METENATVLLVDDDPNILAIFGMALEEEGYQVIRASSGTEGLKLARRHLPDLILSDINMPEMNGKEFLKSLREDEDLGTTQIVLMTGQIRDMNARAGMEIGADDFLEKPFSHEELMQCVRARMRRARIHWKVEDKAIGKIREDLLSTLPHEFFTPLAGILGVVEVLRENFEELPPEEVTNFLGLIEQSGWRLQRTLRNYLMILELQFANNGESECVSFMTGSDVYETLKDAVERVGQRHQRMEDIESNLVEVGLRVSARPLSVIAEELLDNACAYSAHGKSIQISISSEGLLTVVDEGRGMSAEQLRRLRAFQQFDRKLYEQQGLGLGVILSRQLAERCGAQLQIESGMGDGTKVTVAFQPAKAGDEVSPG